MIPSEKAGVVVLVNKNEVSSGNLAEIILNIMRGKVFRGNLNEPLKFNIDNKFLTEDILTEYLGEYEFRQGISEIVIENDKLCIHAPSRLEAVPEKLVLVPVSQDSFMNLYDGQSVSFVRNDDGKITHFLNGGYSYIKI